MLDWIGPNDQFAQGFKWQTPAEQSYLNAATLNGATILGERRAAAVVDGKGSTYGMVDNLQHLQSGTYYYADPWNFAHPVAKVKDSIFFAPDFQHTASGTADTWYSLKSTDGVVAGTLNGQKGYYFDASKTDFSALLTQGRDNGAYAAKGGGLFGGGGGLLAAAAIVGAGIMTGGFGLMGGAAMGGEAAASTALDAAFASYGTEAAASASLDSLIAQQAAGISLGTATAGATAASGAAAMAGDTFWNYGIYSTDAAAAEAAATASIAEAAGLPAAAQSGSTIASIKSALQTANSVQSAASLASRLTGGGASIGSAAPLALGTAAAAGTAAAGLAGADAAALFAAGTAAGAKLAQTQANSTATPAAPGLTYDYKFIVLAAGVALAFYSLKG